MILVSDRGQISEQTPPLLYSLLPRHSELKATVLIRTVLFWTKNVLHQTPENEVSENCSFLFWGENHLNAGPHTGLKLDSISNNHTKLLNRAEHVRKHGMNMCISFIDSVPYSEKKRLLDKQEEIQEVKQLDEWRPAVGIFTAVLEELENKAS